MDNKVQPFLSISVLRAWLIVITIRVRIGATFDLFYLSYLKVKPSDADGTPGVSIRTSARNTSLDVFQLNIAVGVGSHYNMIGTINRLFFNPVDINIKR
ncbi:hypothetical protein COS38_01410 [Candidatus Berkelbacteria bacterium CG03_land_8_20_14_0_80_40_36]|uniref:Uncharacterized protein n=1 Tax=Candidatus Berkelbacteria bacterium CG03_land_8_20_14_0_80_40_36 TaxID=1974509 RepID=A0A2M7CIN2_9BACT|nr:MAG: hypothetical protein COS38_01410 [Candidatus Berkelbacteria bacterium CG03_land_8_20_14_0_80_40_36]